MSKKKKPIEPVEVLTVEEITEQKKVEIKKSFKPSVLFSVKTEESVPLRKYPILDPQYITGQMAKGKIYDVSSITNSGGIEMYRIADGSYIMNNSSLIKL
jgi:hypothetical protein